MLKNYFKVALRTLLQYRAFSLINILGLAVGLSACFLIFLYVRFESSYDNFHTRGDRIYRVVTDVRTPTETGHEPATTGPIAINVKKDFPEVEDAVRLTGDEFLVRKGDVKFQEKRALLADSSLFNIFDFQLVAGDKKTALVHPMSIVISQSAAKKYFGRADLFISMSSFKQSLASIPGVLSSCYSSSVPGSRQSLFPCFSDRYRAGDDHQ